MIHKNLHITAQAANALAEVIIENAPIGIYTVNADGYIDFVNPAFCEISGSNADQLLGLDAFNWPAYKGVGLAELIRGVFEKKNPFDKEIHYTSHLNNKETDRHYIGIPIFNENHEVFHALLLVEDTTERRRLHAELENYAKNLEATILERTAELNNSLTLFTSLVQNMKDGILVEDVNEIITVVNQSYCDLSPNSLNMNDLIGKKREVAIEQFKGLLNKDQTLDTLREIKKKGESITGEEVMFADGRTIERDYIPIMTAQGTLLGHLWQFRDITKKKNVERALRTHAEELERMNNVMVDRELRMVTLKEEIAALKKRLGEA